MIKVREGDLPPVFLFSGPPGAGKSSVARALMRRFPLGLHIPIDNLREWVVSGMAHPLPHWTEETTRQFRLARESAAQMAARYQKAGFAVAIDDIIFPGEVEEIFIGCLSGAPVFRILLFPATEVAQRRNRERTNKEFDTRFLHEPIRAIRQSLAGQPFAEMGWHILDNGELTVEETVDAILSTGGMMAR